MSHPLIAVMQQAMAHSSIPCGFLDLQTLAFSFRNPAMEQVLTRHRMSAGYSQTMGQADLKELAQRCVETLTEQSRIWDISQLQVTLVPLLDNGELIAIQCFAREIADTQAQRMEEALNQLPVGAWIAKPDGEMVWVNHANPAYRPPQDNDAYYYLAEWYKDIHPDDLETCASSFSKAAIKGKVDPFEFRMRVPDGQMHWFYVDGGPIVLPDGSVDRWVGVTMDVQRYKAAQEKLQQEIDRLRAEARAEAQRVQQYHAELSRVQKMELIGELAGSVAHDFNNLLFVIRLNTGLMSRSTQDPKTLEFAQMIQRDVARAARTASELMTFSGRQPQHPQTYEVAKLLQDIEDLLRRAVGAEVDFALELEPDLAPIEVDRTYFENALINLAVNARDAVAGKGKVGMRFRNRQLPRDGEDRHYLEIEVYDNGIGMSEETVARIFEPFFTTKEPGKGTGLGLPMVASFAAQCAGFVEVRSTLGSGTSVLLYLPQSQSGAAEQEDTETVKATGGSENLLLIEDDLHVRNALAQLLIDMGYTVSTAYSPESALQLLRSGLRPKLIISDIRMPGRISAMEMVQQLEAEQILPPVLFMTGYAPDIVIKEGLVDGRFLIVYKPISGDELAAKVREVLDRGPAQSPATGA